LVTKYLEIVWTKSAKSQLREIYKYMSQESVQNAIKVINDLTQAVGDIVQYPEKHKIDQYKKIMTEPSVPLKNIIFGYLIETKIR